MPALLEKCQDHKQPKGRNPWTNVPLRSTNSVKHESSIVSPTQWDCSQSKMAHYKKSLSYCRYWDYTLLQGRLHGTKSGISIELLRSEVPCIISIPCRYHAGTAMSLTSSSLTILTPECDLDSSTPRRHETAIGHIKSCRQFGNLTRFMKVINSLQINWNFLPELYLGNRKRLANGPYLIPQNPISQSPVTQSLRFVALGKQSRPVRSKHLDLCSITSSYLFLYTVTG